MDHLADEQMIDPVDRPKPRKVKQLSPRKPKKIKKVFHDDSKSLTPTPVLK
jgi:hypothetical protein